MLALADPSSDKDIICAPYPKKSISWEKIRSAVVKGYADKNPNVLKNFVGDYVINPIEKVDIDLNKLTEIAEGGTGFMMIQRKAFEKFSDAYPQYLYKPDHARSKDFDGKRKIMQYFQAEIDPKSERYLSEDYWFCQKSREIGLKIWLAPWINLVHMGAYPFIGSLQAIAAIGASPTV